MLQQKDSSQVLKKLKTLSPIQPLETHKNVQYCTHFMWYQRSWTFHKKQYIQFLMYWWWTNNKMNYWKKRIQNRLELFINNCTIENRFSFSLTLVIIFRLFIWLWINLHEPLHNRQMMRGTCQKLYIHKCWLVFHKKSFFIVKKGITENLRLCQGSLPQYRFLEVYMVTTNFGL